MRTTGDQQLLKRINRSVLLRLLRAQPGLSRARLSQQSGLTKSTVSALVRELLDENWLNEASAPVAADGMGRPSTPLRLNTDIRVLIGVEIAVEFLRIVCVSLTGVVISRAEVPLESTQPDRVCKQTTRMVSGLCRELQDDKLVLSGVGVCLPGAINDDSGIVRFAPNLGWRGVKFLEMISTAFADAGVPSTSIHLQNDADAAALSEYEFTTNEGEDPLIFINCDVGVGAGIVLNDRLFTGAIGMAGEIGHTIMQIEGPLCSCGRRGCAETFIGSRALNSQARVDRAGQFLGVLIQNLDVMFNPRTIVLGGKSCINNPDLIGNAIQTLSGYAQRAGVPVPVVRAARYGLLAAAVGAAALVLHRFLRPIPVGAPVFAGANTLKPVSGLSKQERATQSKVADEQLNGASDVSWH
ncbi:MAG TPA: ROK family transcriptional regulator [Burkholderiaceae bacterium]|nr:ROK family transcriptional regulator [Burkholderiaceae bacterium]HPH13448.1 ROK family transcriptional regulator [Burkholderiaceae bacterium]